MADSKISVEDPDDREILIKAGLFVADPAAVSGLAARLDVDAGIDPGFQPIPYDTRVTTRQKVQCAVCTHRAWHNAGFIVRNGAGQTGLVGWECGESRLFGEGGWQEMVNRTGAAQRSALYKFRWKPAREATEVAIDQMTRWAALAESVDAAQDDLADTFPELLAAMRSGMADGTLSVDREISQPIIEPDGSQKTSRRIVREVVLRTKAGWFFRGRTLSKRIVAARRKLYEASKHLTEDATSMSIAETREKLRESRRIVDECIEMQESLGELRGRVLWEGIAKWARSQKIEPGKYRVSGKMLRANNEDYDFWFDLPSPAVDDLQAAAAEVVARWPAI